MTNLITRHYLESLMAKLTTYEKINEEIKFTEDETIELLKLSEKEILVLILSELKKISENTKK